MTARTLIYDIEIAPYLAWVYEMWDANAIKVEQDRFIMCFSYQWLGDESVQCVALPDFKYTYKEDPTNDYLVVSRLWDLMDEADIVVAHNAKRFDNKMASSRFLMHGFYPPSPYKTVDTLASVKRYFSFGKNSLNDLSMRFDEGQKAEQTHGKLWYKCINGDMDAWEQMKVYCNQDVTLLYKLYNKLFPYIHNHPNVATLESREDGCPSCGSTRLQYRGTTSTATGTYRRVFCTDCDSWSRERLPMKDDEGKTFRPKFVNIAG